LKIMPTQKKTCIAVIGSSNTDLVLCCERLPLPGETLLGGHFQQLPGGKGANQAVAAARAGAKVLFIGARGADAFGEKAKSALQQEGIDTRRFYLKKEISSGIALILLGGKKRENMIGVAKSANDSLSVKDIQSARSDLKKAAILVAQLETPLPTILELARLAQQLKLPLLLNPAPARSLPATLLKQVHTLTPNEHEAALLTGKKQPEQAGHALLKKGCQQVVITLGAKGALWMHPQGSQHFPAPRVKAVDTVGAGDCFTGWLATGMAEGLSMGKAIQRALQAASLSVTRSGAQAGMPYRREL
jgi:ribokinase